MMSYLLFKLICKKQLEVLTLSQHLICFGLLPKQLFFLMFCLLVDHNYVQWSLLTQQQKLLKKFPEKKIDITLLFVFDFCKMIFTAFSKNFLPENKLCG